MPPSTKTNNEEQKPRYLGKYRPKRPLPRPPGKAVSSPGALFLLAEFDPEIRVFARVQFYMTTQLAYQYID